MKKERSEEYLKEFSRHLEEEKCVECECLQGAFIQIKLDCPELAKEVEKVATRNFHKCLGCDPCPPAEVWERYLKERDGGS